MTNNLSPAPGSLYRCSLPGLASATVTLASAGSVMFRLAVKGLRRRRHRFGKGEYPVGVAVDIFAGQRRHLRAVEPDPDRLPFVQRERPYFGDDGAAIGADRCDVERLGGVEHEPHGIGAAEQGRRRRRGKGEPHMQAFAVADCAHRCRIVVGYRFGRRHIGSCLRHFRHRRLRSRMHRRLRLGHRRRRRFRFCLGLHLGFCCGLHLRLGLGLRLGPRFSLHFRLGLDACFLDWLRRHGRGLGLFRRRGSRERGGGGRRGHRSSVGWSGLLAAGFRMAPFWAAGFSACRLLPRAVGGDCGRQPGRSRWRGRRRDRQLRRFFGRLERDVDIVIPVLSEGMHVNIADQRDLHRGLLADDLLVDRGDVGGAAILASARSKLSTELTNSVSFCSFSTEETLTPSGISTVKRTKVGCLSARTRLGGRSSQHPRLRAGRAKRARPHAPARPAP